MPTSSAMVIRARSNMIVYRVTNLFNGKSYIGKTNDLDRRKACHFHQAFEKGSMTPFHCALRKYGKDAFEWHDDIRTTEDEVDEIERIIIAAWPEEMRYNLAEGGEGGFVIPVEKMDEWKEKLSASRQGKKPALGMKHSDQNKQVFSECGKRRWDMYGRYPKEVVDYPFAEAHRRFGISKTHYYRLKKEA